MYAYFCVSKFTKALEIMSDMKKEILIIDDSETNIFLLESVLSEYGYNVTSTLNAQEAFKLIDKKKPDLILLDLLMPDISGFDFAKMLKDNPITSHIPIIVISALSDEKSHNSTAELGITEYFEKPVVLTSLIQKIEELLQ